MCAGRSRQRAVCSVGVWVAAASRRLCRGHLALGGGGGMPPRQPPGRRRHHTPRGRVARDHTRIRINRHLAVSYGVTVSRTLFPTIAIRIDAVWISS
jgi:hypothetical protein